MTLEELLLLAVNALVIALSACAHAWYTGDRAWKQKISQDIAALQLQSTAPEKQCGSHENHVTRLQAHQDALQDISERLSIVEARVAR